MSGVSFVIPNYNGRELMRKYLPALIREADLSRDEIIIVDDCSQDSSAEFLKENFPAVLVLELEKNRGFSYAVDYGVYRSKNELICVLNTDVEVLPGFLPPLVRHFSRKEVFAVSSMQEPVNEEPAFYALPAAKMFLGIFLYRYQPVRGKPAVPVQILFAQGAATVYNKEKFIALGGFDGMYSPLYWEDLDICYRAWKRGWSSWCEPASTHHHYIMGTTGGMYKRLYKRIFHWKNRILFTWRNIDSPVLLMEEMIFLPFALFLMPLFGKVEFTLGLFYALLQLPAVVARKLADRDGKTVSDRDIFRRFSAKKVGRIPVSGKTHVLYLHETSLIAGAENSLLNLVRDLDRRSFEPFFILPSPGPLADELYKLDVRCEFLPFPRIRRIWGVMETIRNIVLIIRKNNIALLHSNSIRTHIYAALAGKYCGIPCIWHERNLLQDELVDPDRVLAFLPDMIICNAAAIARRFQAGGGLPGKVRVAFNGVDTGKFSPQISGNPVREEFGIGREEIVVGITSRFNRQKGHDTFLRAAQAVAEGGEISGKVRFLIAGGSVFAEDKERESFLRNMAEKLGLKERVIFAGLRKDMPQVYGAIDIFVLASYAEPCGRVVLEAMASGKPVVASNSGGTPEMIADGVNGFLFKPDDARALAEKIVFLAENPDLAKKIGRAARERIEENFSIERNVRQIQDLYLELLGDPAGPCKENHV